MMKFSPNDQLIPNNGNIILSLLILYMGNII